MANPDTEFLFPPRVIPTLRALRGERWQALVDRVVQAEPADAEEQITTAEPPSPDRLAFVLLMVRLAGCTTCHASSFRALRGCTQCARQAVRRYREDDQKLEEQYLIAREEVEAYLKIGES
jgi:hypothetical protein